LNNRIDALVDCDAVGTLLDNRCDCESESRVQFGEDDGEDTLRSARRLVSLSEF
jgi:hypothetical protein